MVGFDGLGLRREEAGFEDFGLKLRLVDEGVCGILEGWEGVGLSAVVDFCQAPDVAVFNCVV